MAIWKLAQHKKLHLKKRAIYFIYKQKTYTPLYKNYLDAQAAYENMEPKMKAQYQKRVERTLLTRN